jgi:hypothetical protein
MALEDLKTGAITTGQALRQAVEWLRVPANEERVGSGRRSLEREIRRLAVSADKLAAASDRLMCVSVFGPSQVGKSHLVSVLAARARDTNGSNKTIEVRAAFDAVRQQQRALGKIPPPSASPVGGGALPRPNLAPRRPPLPKSCHLHQPLPRCPMLKVGPTGGIVLDL